MFRSLLVKESFENISKMHRFIWSVLGADATRVVSMCCSSYRYGSIHMIAHRHDIKFFNSNFNIKSIFAHYFFQSFKKWVLNGLMRTGNHYFLFDENKCFKFLLAMPIKD